MERNDMKFTCVQKTSAFTLVVELVVVRTTVVLRTHGLVSGHEHVF